MQHICTTEERNPYCCYLRCTCHVDKCSKELMFCKAVSLANFMSAKFQRKKIAFYYFTYLLPVVRIVEELPGVSAAQCLLTLMTKAWLKRYESL